MFSVVSLLFVYYNNKYTKYKLTSFTNIYIYLLFLSFFSIQLIEYFIWKDIHNTEKNKLYSIIQIVIILLQPYFSIMAIESDKELKSNMLKLYIGFVIVIVYIYMNTKQNMSVDITENGHLKWNRMPNKEYIYFVMLWCLYFVFLLYPLYIEHNRMLLLFFCVTLIISLVTYLKYRTYESMWCWLSNFAMLICLFMILFYLPYHEKSCS